MADPMNLPDFTPEYLAEEAALAAQVAERERLFGPDWTAMTLRNRALIERNALLDGRMRVTEDWVSPRLAEHVDLSKRPDTPNE